MRRGFWFAAGAGAGAYAMMRGRRLAEAFTADGLADRWHALALGARMFRDEVAQGQVESELELRERFGLVPHGLPELARAGSTGHPAVGSADRPSREDEGEG
jgi:hypothetical protein